MNDEAQTGLVLIGFGCLIVGIIVGYAVGMTDRRPPEKDPADWWKHNDEEGTWYGQP